MTYIKEGCVKCERSKKNLLVTGKNVCSYCEEWRNECEARALLRLPLLKRRSALLDRGSRGKYLVDKLKETMRDVWLHNKKH